MPNEIYHRSNWGESKAEDFGDVYYDHAATNKLFVHSDYYENSWETDKTLRDLNNKASIVLTPTAYSDGSLNTVIPPYAPSYIENVAFVTSEWNLLTEGWSIDETNNKLVAEATWTGINKRAQYIVPEITVGKTVKFSFDVVVTAGKFHFSAPFGSGSVGYGSPDFINQSGSYSFTYVASGISASFRNKSTDFAGEITNIRVEVIEEADFDFSRGSSATRVNEQGLVEDSQGDDYPRIDFTDGTGSLLLEPQRTNLYLNSEPTSNEGSASGITYESFDWSLGFTNCVKFGDNSTIRFRYGSLVSSSTEYTISVFVIMDDLSEPVASTSSSTGDFSFVLGNSLATTINGNVNLGNNVYKVSATHTTPQASTNNGIVKYTTQSSKGFRVVGWQIEEGSYATSYIVSNSGSTTTRSADVANNSGNADLFNDSEGVLYAEIAALADDSTYRQIAISDGTTDNRIALMYTNASNSIRSQVRVSASNQFDQTTTAYTITENNKIAIKYKANDFALWINGVQVFTDTSGTTPTGLNELAFDDGAGNNDFYGNTKAVAVFKEALTDEQLEKLTS